MKFILGKKIEMTQIFDEKSNVVPVTLIEAGPCFVLRLKSKDKDKYEALQVGFEKMKEGKVRKSMKDRPYRNIKEFSVREGLKAGDKIDVSIFEPGERVTVSGVSKGKGYAGGVKRWGFHGRNATHGVKHEERGIGSTGCRFPQRVIPGRKMPGRMGAWKVTVKNLKVIKVDLDNNILAVEGAVPGKRGTLLEIKA